MSALLTEMLPQGQSMPETMTEPPSYERSTAPEYEPSTTQAKDTAPSYVPEPAPTVVRPGETQPTTQPIYNGDYVEPLPTVMPEPVPMTTTETGGNVWGSGQTVPTTETSGNVWGPGQTLPVTDTSGNMW